MFLSLALLQLISVSVQASQALGVECVLEWPEQAMVAESAPEPEITPTSRPPNPKTSWDLRFYLDNDDKLMGLWGYLFPKTSNDLGFTHGMNLELSRARGAWVWTGRVGAELYTRMPERVIYPETSKRSVLYFHGGDGVYSSGYPETSVFENARESVEAFSGWDGQKLSAMVRFIDVTRAQVSARYGENRYIEANVGAEIRNRDPANGSPARSIQDWWHHQVLNTYQYDYVSPNREAPVLGAPREFKTRVMDESGALYFEQVGNVDVVARPEVPEEKLAQFVAPWSVNVGVRVGGQEEIRANCHCRLVAHASGGVQLETEATTVVGPNSRATVETGITVETRPGASDRPARFAATVAQTVNYHPTGNRDLGSRFGAVTRLETEARLGHQGLVRPFFSLLIPRGRKNFQEFNDNDSIMRIGVRMRLQK